MAPPPRPTLFDFHGVSMTKYFTDNWDNVQNFKARPDDILLATYPKAGRLCFQEWSSETLLQVNILKERCVVNFLPCYADEWPGLPCVLLLM